MQNLDKVAEKYLSPPELEVENNLIMNWYPERVAKHFDKVSSLLELGLGHGYTVPHFQKICDNHYVLEGSARVIEHFRSQNSGYDGTLIEGYFETFEPKEKFDLIVMGFVLEHVENPISILKRYREFLTPNGRIVIAVPNAKSLNRRYGLAMGMIDDIYALNEADLQLGHLRNYCLDTLQKDVSSAQLATHHIEGIYLKPMPLSVLQTLDDVDSNLQAMLEVGVDFPELCVALLLQVGKN